MDSRRPNAGLMAGQTGKESLRAVSPYLQSSTTAVGLPETSLGRQDPYEEGGYHFQRRYPSPGIRSNSEEVSDKDNLSEQIQAPCEHPTQQLSPQYYSAQIGSDTSNTPLVMDDTPYLIGYPEGDFVEKSDQAAHTLPASNRPLSPETPPNDSFSHNSIVNMETPATGFQPTIHNDSSGHLKAEAGVEDKKRSFLYQSSSGEDDDSSNDGRHDETENNGNDKSIRPSSPQVSSRPPRKSTPLSTFAESIRARAKSANIDPMMAAYQPMPPGGISWVRVQEALARKKIQESEKKNSNAPANSGISSRSQYTTNNVSTGRQNPIEGPRAGASGTGQDTFAQALQAGNQGGVTKDMSSIPSIGQPKNKIQYLSGAEPVRNGLPTIESHTSSPPVSRGPVRTGTPSAASQPGTPIDGARSRKTNAGTSTSVAPRTGPPDKAPQREGLTATKKSSTVAAKAVQSNAPASSTEARNIERAPATGTNARASPSGAKKTASSPMANARGTPSPSNAKKTAPSKAPAAHATAGSSSMIKKTAAPRAPATQATNGPSNAKKTARTLAPATHTGNGPSSVNKTGPSRAPATQAVNSPSNVKKTAPSQAPATQATTSPSNARKTASSQAPATQATTGPSNAKKTARTPAPARKPPTAPPTSLVMRDMLEEINGSAAPAAPKPTPSNAPPKSNPATKSASKTPRSTAANPAPTPPSKTNILPPTLQSPLPNQLPIFQAETPHHNTTSYISSPSTISTSNTPPTHSPSKVKNEPTNPQSLSSIPHPPAQKPTPRAYDQKVHIRRPSGPTDFDIFIPPTPGVDVPSAVPTPVGDATSGAEALGIGGREGMAAAPGPSVPARSAATEERKGGAGLGDGALGGGSTEAMSTAPGVDVALVSLGTPAGSSSARGGGKEKLVRDAAVTNSRVETVDGVAGGSKEKYVNEERRGNMGITNYMAPKETLGLGEEKGGRGADVEEEGREVMSPGSGVAVVGDKSRDGDKVGAAGGEKVKNVPKNVVRFPKKKAEQDKGDEGLTLLVPTPPAHPVTASNQITNAVQATPNPLLDPYFTYRIKQKTWSESASEESATTTTIGSTSTILETANREAEELFTQIKNQFTSSFAVQHKTSTSSHTDDGCLEAKGTLSSIGWPAGDVFFKVWVERGIVPAEVVPFHPPPAHTPFIRKTLYILRLYKLTKAPRGADDSNPADRPKELSSSDSDSDSAADSGPGSSSVSDPDPKGTGTTKKRRAETAPGDSPSAKRCKVASTPATQDNFLRTYQEVACPEVYTTLAGANAAACNLQISIMETTTPLREDQRVEAVARLKGKVVELEGRQGGEGYWRSEFPVGFSGRSKFELVVERVGVCGPRNV